MPHTDFSPSYTVTFNASEFRIVGLALAGRLKDREDIEAALRLNFQILGQRVSHLDVYMQQSKKALENADRALLDINQNTEKHGT